MDDGHRPSIDPHSGEAKMGMDDFFLARATGPQHAKAVLNCLDFQSGAVFSAKVVLRLYISGTPGRLQTCPSWTTDGTKACGWAKAWHKTITTLEHRQECGGVDPSGYDQRTNDGTERC